VGDSVGVAVAVSVGGAVGGGVSVMGAVDVGRSVAVAADVAVKVGTNVRACATDAGMVGVGPEGPQATAKSSNPSPKRAGVKIRLL
jgi:hypothetical protein